jgi:hypothetical protein
MPQQSDPPASRKASPNRKDKPGRKEETVSAKRSLEEYQKLACAWDPNAPRPAEPEHSVNPPEKTAKGRRQRLPKPPKYV